MCKDRIIFSKSELHKHIWNTVCAVCYYFSSCVCEKETETKREKGSSAFFYTHSWMMKENVTQYRAVWNIYRLYLSIYLSIHSILQSEIPLDIILTQAVFRRLCVNCLLSCRVRGLRNWKWFIKLLWQWVPSQAEIIIIQCSALCHCVCVWAYKGLSECRFC